MSRTLSAEAKQDKDIKFRGKSINNTGSIKQGDWVTGSFFNKDKDTVINVSQNNGKSRHIAIDSSTLSQNTNIRDMNKKEIYENDILVDSSNEYCLVLKMPGGPCLFPREEYRHYLNGDKFRAYPIGEEELKCLIGKAMKVVGNIFDTPELLQEPDREAEEIDK